MTQNKNKVAIISTSLGSGGAERFASLLSFMLEKLNIEVHNIIINDVVDYEYAGKLMNLGIESTDSFPFFKKIRKGFLLNHYLKKNGINGIIDNRPRNNLTREIITKWIYGDRRKWFLVHSYNTDTYFPKPIFFSKFLYQNAEKIICVSQAIEEIIKYKFDFKNTVTIHNLYDFSKIEIEKKIPISEQYIMYFGRFDEKVKNFSLMLEAFYLSKIHLQGYKLLLMGEGPDLGIIQENIKLLQLEEFVIIYSFNKNPFQFVKQAKFTILTSRYEGFPLSIVESLALGTPVISVDCKSGPNELIKDGFNGLLVENNNPHLFATAMKQLVDDTNLYDFCKKNAAKSVEHLSLETISKQWESILF
ncbi:glycosyltransferase [Flavobacterium sp. ZS1P70]|uniref:Glycosyltransferase n=1 Tax=Flavobacterium zhoui TaxID=3230414 RepID=A0ABW6I3H8_9FLAO